MYKLRENGTLRSNAIVENYESRNMTEKPENNVKNQVTWSDVVEANNGTKSNKQQK